MKRRNRWEPVVLPTVNVDLEERSVVNEYRTKSGKTLTDADIQALADEAERGYDISHLLRKNYSLTINFPNGEQADFQSKDMEVAEALSAIWENLWKMRPGATCNITIAANGIHQR